MLLLNSIFLLGTIAVNLRIVRAYAQPYVAWSMDNSSGTHLFPEPGRGRRWIGDLTALYESSPQDVFKVGVRGQAIFIRSATVVLARNLSKSECVLNTTSCTKGITVSFWMKLQSFGNTSTKEHSVIQASNSCSEALYISATKTSLNFQVGGKTLHVGFFLEDYGWTHVGVIWNAEESTEIVAYLNGSQRSGQPISNKSNCTLSGGGNIIAGDLGGASFYLDELEIYYEVLNSSNILELALFQHDSTNSPSQQHNSKAYTRLIVMTTVIPAAGVVMLVVITYFLMRKRRTRKTLRQYIRQTSRNHHAHNDSSSNTDVEEERSELDSEGEMERLQHWFRSED